MFYHITNNKVCMLIFFHVFLNDLSCPWFAKHVPVHIQNKC